MMRQRIKRWLAVGGTAAGLVAVGAVYQPTVVVGESMAPTLSDGKVIYLDRLYYRSHAPRRGEVVVFNHDGDVCVKRVYRAPGESLYYLTSGGTWIGFVQPERLEDVRNRYTGHGRNLRLVRMDIPADRVYVLGDNLNKSEDSRVIGPIPVSELLGRAHLEVNQAVVRPFEFGPRPVPSSARHRRPAPPADRELSRTASAAGTS